TDDSGSERSGSEDEKPKKKPKKDVSLACIICDRDTMMQVASQKKAKSLVESALNEKITLKIVQLQNRWACSKAGCSSNHCFIHPEHPDHFLIGHEQLSVWASAWVVFSQFFLHNVQYSSFGQ